MGWLVFFFAHILFSSQNLAKCKNSHLLTLVLDLFAIYFRIQILQSLIKAKDVMQGKLFQKCTHLLYCSVLSLGGNVNTRRMLQPDMGSIFHLKNQ